MADGFTYVDAPTASSATPDAGPAAGGTLVTITGTHLSATTAVSFGGAESADVDVLDDQTVTALAPAGALGSADIVAHQPGRHVHAGRRLHLHRAADASTSVPPTWPGVRGWM